MMKIYNNIYCTSESLEEILAFQDVYLELFKLIKICNVIIELEDDEMQNLITPSVANIQLHSFFKEKSTFHNNNPNIFQIFQSKEKLQKEVDHISNDIFILNLNESECENIRNKFGLFVISSDNLNYIKKFNQPPDGWSWQQGESFLADSITNKKIKISEWKNLFKGLEIDKIIPPYNGVIINDQYLFADFKKYNHKVSNNIKSLIEGLLPKELCIEFEVLLVFGSYKSIINKKTGEVIEELCIKEDEINSALSNLRSWSAKFNPQKISFSIVTVDIKERGYHNRAVYFNHGISISNYGFIAFYNDIPVRENDLNMKWSYNAINSSIFNIMPIQKIQTFKNRIKELIDSDSRINNTYQIINSTIRLLNFNS